jgi:hypothetical protein
MEVIVWVSSANKAGPLSNLIGGYGNSMQFAFNFPNHRANKKKQPTLLSLINREANRVKFWLILFYPLQSHDATLL